MIGHRAIGQSHQNVRQLVALAPRPLRVLTLFPLESLFYCGSYKDWEVRKRRRHPRVNYLREKLQKTEGDWLYLDPTAGAGVVGKR